jgi:hypothetical protein
MYSDSCIGLLHIALRAGSGSLSWQAEEPADAVCAVPHCVQAVLRRFGLNLPEGHAAQAVDPLAWLNFPGGQSRHHAALLAVLLFENWPGKQLAQVPLLDEYLPATQAVQATALSAPDT